MSRKEDVRAKKAIVAKLFGSECYVCHRKFGKGFTFHHLYYLPTEKYYKDFKNGDDYNEYIVEIVKKNPKQFLLLCKKHHIVVEWMLMYKPETFKRLLKAITISKKNRNSYIPN